MLTYERKREKSFSYFVGCFVFILKEKIKTTTFLTININIVSEKLHILFLNLIKFQPFDSFKTQT